MCLCHRGVGMTVLRFDSGLGMIKCSSQEITLASFDAALLRTARSSIFVSKDSAEFGLFVSEDSTEFHSLLGKRPL